MNQAQIDLAHTVALGLIDDEDHHAIQTIIDTEDPTLCSEFLRELRDTREALAELGASTPTPPPPALRTRLLAAIAAEEPPVAS
ncbi:RskA family anti-sigma factor [Nocardia rhizosphaerae]|uniref:Anti-sigma-K factor RskA N-terminal domain-containing protein n=1 Tax=Nocardia rhizosphaerae TaxID=1691571 RepID=A0ABV8L1Y2_9NOCA